MFKFLKDKLRRFIKKKGREIAKQAEEVKEKEEVEGKELLEEMPLKKQEIVGRIEAKQEAKEEVKQIKVEGIKKEEPGKEEKIAEEGKRKGLFTRFMPRKTIRISEGIFDKFWEELEMLLLKNNVALEVSDMIKESLKEEFLDKEIEKNRIEELVKEALKKALENLIIEPFDICDDIKIFRKDSDEPYIIVFFGINGSGKTTTIAKMAHLLKNKGFSCVLAASDTFRAASIEQLEKHAANLNVKVIKHDYGADAAAVAYDAISHAKSAGIDAVLVDTAGRMHTQSNLMREMEKICRVTKPNLKVFVGETIVGNDMVEQARRFNDAIGIDAIILTKADVDEKGGATISISRIVNKPILFLGIGQKYPDLEEFRREKILSSLGL